MTILCALQALGLSYAGMAALALAMDRHYAQLTRCDEVPARHRLLLRAGAIALLPWAYAPCVAAWGASVGTAAFIGFLSAGALPVALLLPWRPRLVASLAVSAPALSALGLAWRLSA